MKHLVSVGGGFTSTIELPLLVVEKYGRDNVDLVISCLAGESPDLWRLVEACEDMTRLKVKRITYAPYCKYLEDAPSAMWWDIWDVFFATGMMGSTRLDPCSRVLKRETLRAYIEDHYDPAQTTMHVGITAHEIDRMMAIKANWSKSGYTVEAPLCDVELVGTTKERCQRMLGWVPFLYTIDASHNNCGGFCVKAGYAQMARLLWYLPDTYAYHEMQERRFREQFERDATIMRKRKTRGGVMETTPYSLEEFRCDMERKWASMLPGFDPFDGLEDTKACTFCDTMG